MRKYRYYDAIFLAKLWLDVKILVGLFVKIELEFQKTLQLYKTMKIISYMDSIISIVDNNNGC